MHLDFSRCTCPSAKPLLPLCRRKAEQTIKKKVYLHTPQVSKLLNLPQQLLTRLWLLAIGKILSVQQKKFRNIHCVFFFYLTLQLGPSPSSYFLVQASLVHGKETYILLRVEEGAQQHNGCAQIINMIFC